MTNHNQARRIYPTLFRYPSCSTRVLHHSSCPGFDSSCWHRLRFHQDTCHLGCKNASAETVTPRPDTVYRSMLQICDQGTDVHRVTGCSLPHLHAEYSTNDVAMSCIWTNTTNEKRSPHPPDKVDPMTGFVLYHKRTADNAVIGIIDVRKCTRCPARLNNRSEAG